MRTDALVFHSNDVGAVVGEFYGTPIREVSTLAVELREELDAQSRARLSLGEPQPEVELLPGEVIRGNIIRRETAAEVVGDKFYEPQPEQGVVGLQPLDYWDNFYAEAGR